MRVKQISTVGKSTIVLGKQGENHVTEVLFPQFPDMMAYEWVLNHQRATDSSAYPCPLEKRGNDLVWVVTAGDTEVVGTGVAELTCYGTGGEVLKSQTWSTVTQRSPATGGSVPNPVEPWYQQLVKLLRGKVDEPEEEGQPGYHLATDGKGNRYWADGGWPKEAATLLVQILSSGTYTTDQTANITALAEMLGVAYAPAVKKLAAPVIRLETDKQKLTAPIIQLVEEQEVSTTAVLGEAVLGHMILGDGIPQKLATPAITLETVEEDTRKLSKPTIYLQEIVSAFKLATPTITLQEG